LKGRKGHDVQDLKEELKALDEVSREFVEEIAPTPIRSPRPTNLKKGDTVKIAGYSQTGRLLADPADGKAHVLVGALKMTVDAADLSVAEVAPPKRLAGKSTRLQLDRAFEISPEVHLRLMPADEAMQKLDRYLDDAVLAGLDTVRVVHGKGTGTLRRLSHEMLRSHGAVKSFRMATITEGGGGVTIAELKR
jgi:DNA mismatch repair protein MutS2